MKTRTLAVIGAAALLGACSDMDAPTQTAPEAADPILAAIEARGFRSDMVQDMGDYVLVEGDIHFTKDELLRPAPRSADPAGPRFQYVTNNRVDRFKVNNINVDVSGLASQPGWQAAAREALTHWSGITSSHVRLVEGGPADITVTTTCTSYNVAASASFPSGGNPGNVIYVNTCFGYSTSHAQKVHNMVHEFGHTLGFRHSNYTKIGETAGTIGAIHIWNTPTSGNDPGSVMNGGTALNSWAGFSAGDLTATRSIYPLPAPGGLSVTDAGGVPLFGWSAAPGAVSYSVTLITFEYTVDQYGQEWYQGRYFTPLGTTTGTSWLDTDRSYTGEASCTYEGWGGGPYLEPGSSQTRRNWYEYSVVATYPNGSSPGDNARIYAPVAQPGCGWW